MVDLWILVQQRPASLHGCYVAVPSCAALSPEHKQFFQHSKSRMVWSSLSYESQPSCCHVIPAHYLQDCTNGVQVCARLRTRPFKGCAVHTPDQAQLWSADQWCNCATYIHLTLRIYQLPFISANCVGWSSILTEWQWHKHVTWACVPAAETNDNFVEDALHKLTFWLTQHTHIHFMALWTLSGITQLSWYQSESEFYWSKRQWVALASAGPYENLHLITHR